MSRRASLTALIAGAWLLTMVAGFVAGRRSAPQPDATATPATATPSSHTRLPSRADDPSGRRAARPNSRTAGAAAAANPAQLDDLLSEVDRNNRTRRFLDYLARLSDDEFATLAAQLTTGPQAELRRNEYAMLLTEWAARDPYAAAEYLQTGAHDDWERETLLAAWAARDPQAAFDWAAAAPDEGEVNNWVGGAMRGIAASNPELARQLLESMEPGRTREHALRNSIGLIAALGAEQAGSWAAAIADESLRQEATRNLAWPLARTDAPSAGSWVASIADTPARRDASEIVSEQWARADLASARQWVESLPENTRTEAAEGVAQQFGRTDPQAGADWLRTLGDNPDLDGARRRFIDSAAGSDPATAATVVSTLSDQGAQNGYYQRIIGQWASRDANAARSWVNANAAALPEALVRRFVR